MMQIPINSYMIKCEIQNILVTEVITGCSATRNAAKCITAHYQLHNCIANQLQKFKPLLINDTKRKQIISLNSQLHSYSYYDGNYIIVLCDSLYVTIYNPGIVEIVKDFPRKYKTCFTQGQLYVQLHVCLPGSSQIL